MALAEKYNAFISYRHSEIDNKIASEIQTQLERFKIPKQIQKKTGIKRFDRIFRDKEELPTTSDLKHDIENALKVSDFLIVICSERTHESLWVQREIETFLKYHSKEEVFTVLVDGEPGDVIPDILLHQTVTRQLSDGTYATFEELAEPLSCDYRMPIRKARKEELPRLVCSMLHCTYDELMMRRRQYKIRRFAAFASVIGVFLTAAIVYLLWSRAQIKANYDQALVNQSKYLSYASGTLLKDGDRAGALQLALAAMPTESENRPLTSAGYYAMSDALGAYLAPGLMDLTAVWKYDTGSTMKKFFVDAGGDYFTGLDKSGKVTVWDMNSHGVLQTFKGSDASGINDMVLTADNDLVLASHESIACYAFSDLEKKWEIPFEEAPSDYDNIKLNLSAEAPVIMARSYDWLILADAADGKVIRKVVFDDIDFWGSKSLGLGCTVSELTVSRDGKQVLMSYSDSAAGLDDYKYAIYDAGKDSWKQLSGLTGYQMAASFTPDGHVAVLTEPDIFGSSFDFGGISYGNESVRTVWFYDKDGRQLWTCDVPYTATGFASRVFQYDVEVSEGVREPAIVTLFSDRCGIINIKTGELMRTVSLPSSFIEVYSSGKYLRPVLRNGTYYAFAASVSDDSMVSKPYFEDDVESSAIYSNNAGFLSFIIQYDDVTAVTVYSSDFHDMTFDPENEAPKDAKVYDSIVAGNILVTFDDDMTLRAYNLDQEEHLWNAKIDGDYYTSVNITEVSDDGKLVYFTNDNSNDDGDSLMRKTYSVDLETGDVEFISSVDKYLASDDESDGKTVSANDGSLTLKIREGGTAILDNDGNDKYVIPDEGRKVLAGDIFNNEILLLYDDGTYVRYTKGGEVIDTTDLDLSMVEGSTGECGFVHYEKYMFINANGYTFIISNDDQKMLAWTYGVLGYYEKGNKLICKANDDRYPAFGYFTIKSFEELQEQAREYLGDTVMSDEMKAQYGIE